MPYLFLTFHARTLRSGPVPVRVRDPAGVHARDRLPLPGERPGGEDKGEGHQGQEDQKERLPDGILGKGGWRRTHHHVPLIVDYRVTAQDRTFIVCSET